MIPMRLLTSIESPTIWAHDWVSMVTFSFLTHWKNLTPFYLIDLWPEPYGSYLFIGQYVELSPTTPRLLSYDQIDFFTLFWPMTPTSSLGVTGRI